MKKLLLTTLLAALATAGYAQSSTPDTFGFNAEDSMSIASPQEITITRTNDNVNIMVKYLSDDTTNEWEYSPGINPVQSTTIEANNTNLVGKRTTVFTNADIITLIKSAESFRVIVTKYGEEGYRYSITQQGKSAQTATVHRETSNGWNFCIPFIDKGGENEQNQPHKFIPHADLTCSPTFGMGLVSATGQSGDVDLSFSNGSFEFILDKLIGIDYHMTRRQHLNLNFGLNWRNYRMLGDRRFIKEGNQVVTGDYPEGANVKFSRIKIFSLTLALTYDYHFNKHFGIGLGPVVSFNTGGNIKTRWSVDGQPDKDRQYNIRQNPVTVDFMGLVYTAPLAFYFKYSPCNVMTHDRGPEFRSMSAGILLTF